MNEQEQQELNFSWNQKKLQLLFRNNHMSHRRADKRRVRQGAIKPDFQKLQNKFKLILFSGKLSVSFLNVY